MAKIIVPYGRNRIAYAVIKSLAKAGHEVYAADSIGLAMCKWSRYCKGHMLYPNNNDDFVIWAKDKVLGGYLIFPTFQEAWILKQSGLDVPVPNYETIMQANNKFEVHKLCRKLSIPTPETEYIKDGVLKKLDGRGALGRLYIKDMLLQERVYGDAIGVGMLFDTGKLRAKFSWKRLSEYPKDGGMSIVRESIYAPVQEEYAEHLLAALNWHGPAMVEFKGDYVLEINPRFWGSLALAINSGVNFPKLLVDMMIKGKCKAVTGWNVGVKTSWLAGCLLRRCRPRGVTEDFSITDPLPFFVQFLTVTSSLLRGRGLVLDERR